MLLHVYIVVIFAYFGYTRAQIGQCTGNDSCICVYDDGVIVSLEGLSRADGNPQFANVSDSRGDLYSWNPCRPFTYEGDRSECVDVAVCMIRRGIPYELFYDLGSEDSGKFNVDENGTLTLTYTADMDDFKRIAVITLQCNDKSVFDFFVAEGEQDENDNTVLYKLLLYSRHACANAPNLKPVKQVSSLSAGLIVVIVLFSLVGAYLVLGVFFQVVVKKKTGKRIFPNHEFWCNLPSLISCGCKSVKPSSKSINTDKGAKYDSI